MERVKEFNKIHLSLKDEVRYKGDDSLVILGDSLDLLKKVPDNSVSLILTDPPYHSTKKDNIYGDKAFEKDTHFIDWMLEFAREWKRILKPNGSLFCYCSPTMSARLEVAFMDEFNILSQVVWTKPNEPGFDGWKQKMKKEALRQWYPHTERIIFAEPAFSGNLHRSYFGQLLRDMRTKAGLSGHQLTEMVGAYGKVNHGGAVSNWEAGRNIPSEEQYQKMSDALESTGKVGPLPNYRDTIRKFYVNGSIEFTDVWNFPSVRPYAGKHPAEKPIQMLEHIIEATTYEHDIVLDCFAGSGNTAVAAKRLNRLSISMEIEPQWVDSISNKLAVLNIQNEKISVAEADQTSRVYETPQTLFA